MPSKPSSPPRSSTSGASKAPVVLRAGAPRTWLVRHPDASLDARVWIVDERVQDWHAVPTWSDLNGEQHGSPGKPWPREIYEWVKAGVTPVVVPMSAMDYVIQPAWWKGLVWNDVRQAWLLGWEPLNSTNVAGLWERSSLENRLLALEKTPALRLRLGVGPTSDRYQQVLQATIDGVRADPTQPALLVNVLEICAQEWREPPIAPIASFVDGDLEEASEMDEGASVLDRPRDVDEHGQPRARFSLKRPSAPAASLPTVADPTPTKARPCVPDEGTNDAASEGHGTTPAV